MATAKDVTTENKINIVTNTENNVTVTQPSIQTVEILTGPQGPAGAIGPAGPSGSSGLNTGSLGSTNITGTLTVTGSVIISGSSTLTNIGPAIFNGPITSSGNISASIIESSQIKLPSSATSTNLLINNRNALTNNSDILQLGADAGWDSIEYGRGNTSQHNIKGIITSNITASGNISSSGTIESAGNITSGTSRILFTTSSIVYSGSNVTQVTQSFGSTQQITNIVYSVSFADGNPLSVSVTGSDGVNKLYTLTYSASLVTQIIQS